ncbi:alpha/beta hydrolase-fold protein [Streptomyces sp. RFCAC02]|uniref:alpha/beta hydrolase-fold protein n=1 Tax=Streptomyces sp. RFCAC02 TaxID=2499143 RepID=UPI0019D10EAF|nr:alpha/beta hydrolase-fold protein [Streptomyces sp. RFCAC02]
MPVHPPAAAGTRRPRLTRPPRTPGPWRPVDTVPSPRLAPLVRRLDAGADPRTTLDDFWRATGAEGTPLIDPDVRGDAAFRTVTFLWRGAPDTTGVLLAVNKLHDPADPCGARMELVPGTDVWHLAYRLRADHIASYRIAPLHAGRPLPAAGGPELRAWLGSHGTHDPLNPRTLPTRWNGAPGSVLALPDGPYAAGAPAPRPGTARGTVTRHRLALAGTERDVWVYLPPGHDPQAPDGPRTAAGLVVLFDGDMWFPHLRAGDMLDALVADGRTPPLAVVAPDAIDTPTRFRELGEPQDFLRPLADTLLPWARRFGVPAGPDRTLVAGQSLGGLAALYAGLTMPDRFGCVLAQSPSLWWTPPGAPERSGGEATWMSEQWASAPRTGIRARLQAGRYEGSMAAQSTVLHGVLRERGHDAGLTVVSGGHDYAWWIPGLADGLADLTGHWTGAAPALTGRRPSDFPPPPHSSDPLHRS